MRKILEQTPGRFLRVRKGIFDEVVGCAEIDRPYPDEPRVHDYCIHCPIHITGRKDHGV